MQESALAEAASYETEEATMSEPTNKRDIADALRRELESQTIPRPVLALERANPNSSETDANAIPKEFLDAILEVIAYSIEQILVSVLARRVAAAVEQATRPLTEEVALLRIAFENDWNRSNQNK
ncbi:MAG: hypothetical protein WCB27_00155 [Thermoguttaceae bacterium]